KELELLYKHWPVDKRKIEELLISAKTFGFTFFKFNIREDANYLRNIFLEISKVNGLNVRSAIDKILEGVELKIPNRLIKDEKLWFEKISNAINEDDAVESFIISNTESVDDVLGVLALIKLFKFKHYIKIVPLFESKNSLENCDIILEELFNNKHFKSYINNRTIEIMIGYSDSTKACGFFNANLLLYKAQQKIANVCNKYKQDFIIFHGRGGTIGRGGGPTHLAIQSLPKSIGLKFKFTEQGEVIHSKYSTKHLAFRNLESLLTGFIKKEFVKEYKFSDSEIALLEKISSISYNRYRSLIDHPNFFEFFRKVTPIDWITTFRIGLRPAIRKRFEFKSLRAIPYVFSWNQIRMIVPGWFGFGFAYDQLTNLEKSILKKLYLESGFIKSVIDLMEMSLAKSDANVFEFYVSNLAEDYKDLKEMIIDEFYLTIKACSDIKNSDILEDNPVLKRSIELRNPYVDPLHIIQVDGLKNNSKILIYRTLNGIASALRNTG
ncbi:MAG: phosphoenolpyruvate carboxylase, partial [bacterium]|nr:phosphoenolpyruvate carboxylase [bacterium]